VLCLALQLPFASLLVQHLVMLSLALLCLFFSFSSLALSSFFLCRASFLSACGVCVLSACGVCVRGVCVCEPPGLVCLCERMRESSGNVRGESSGNVRGESSGNVRADAKRLQGKGDRSYVVSLQVLSRETTRSRRYKLNTPLSDTPNSPNPQDIANHK